MAVVLGCALGTFFMAFHSTQGPQLGLPQMIQSRPQFGYAGALLVWVVALIAYIGFNAFNEVLCAQALHQLSPAVAPNSARTIIVFALAAASLAAVGYDKIHLAQRGFAYLMIVILTVFSVGALFLLKFPAEQCRWTDFRMVPFLSQLFAAASYQLSWSIYVSDYSRYLPHDVGTRESFWWTYLGAFIGGTWMMLVGTVAAAAFPKLDLAAAMQARRRPRRTRPGQRAAGGLAARAGHHLRAQLLRRLADFAQRRRYAQAVALHGRQAPRERCGCHRGLDGAGADVIRRLHQSLWRFSGLAAVSVHALDRHQPGGFLLGAQVPLLDPRDLQSTRHVRPLELAWPARLRRRLCVP